MCKSGRINRRIPKYQFCAFKCVRWRKRMSTWGRKQKNCSYDRGSGLGGRRVGAMCERPAPHTKCLLMLIETWNHGHSGRQHLIYMQVADGVCICIFKFVSLRISFHWILPVGSHMKFKPGTFSSLKFSCGEANVARDSYSMTNKSLLSCQNKNCSFRNRGTCWNAFTCLCLGTCSRKRIHAQLLLNPKII